MSRRHPLRTAAALPQLEQDLRPTVGLTLFARHGMPMERATEIFAAVQCLVIGLSHVFRSRDWVQFFVWLRGKGPAGVFVNGFLSLGFGSVIVAFHNVWDGLPAVLTVFGWAQVLKGLMCFVFPQFGLRSLERVSPDRPREFVVAGVVMLALSAVFWYIVFTRPGAL